MQFSRFLLGLVGLAIATAVFKYTTGSRSLPGQDPSGQWAVLGETAATVLVGLVIGLACWVLVRLVRGAANAPNPLRIAISGATVLVVVTMAADLLLDRPHSAALEAFVSRIAESCVPSMRANSAYDGYADEQLRAQCTCLAEGMADQLTGSEIRQYSESGALPASVRSKAAEVAGACEGRHLGS